METVFLFRKYEKDCTTGIAALPSGETVRTIERPWLDNKSNVSCYPEGIYHCKWLERSASGKYKRCWHVQDVPNRQGILWHAANVASQLRGCTAPGMKHGKLWGKRAVLSSGKALNMMRKELGGQDFTLIVTSL